LANFPQTSDHIFAGDITEVDEKDIPNHEILLQVSPVSHSA
jgi:DNA (cytosine-5)-methyltransferase 1